MTKYKVAICRFPGSGFEHHGCTTWLMKTAVEMSKDGRIEHCELIVESDTPITMSRNRAVKQALAMGCDYILMVDSDMVPDYLVGRSREARPFWTTAWNWMMKRREEEEDYREKLGDSDGLPPGAEEAVFELFPPATLAAPYCGPPPEELVYVFRWKDYESDTADPPVFRLEMIEREDAFFRAGIERAAALPTGLILYDARLFEQTRPKAKDDDPWFAYEWGDIEQSIKATTEDVFQTRNAALLGYPQHVIWDSWAVHVKTKMVKKPNLITEDQVRKSFIDAVRAGKVRNERLAFVSPYDGPDCDAAATAGRSFHHLSCPAALR